MLVTIEHEGKTYEVECDGHDNILDAAIDAGIENLSYDCKMGVCMTCPSRVTAGKVDQAGSMLSDDVEEKGFALLCCAVPLEEGVVIKTVTEEELLDEHEEGPDSPAAAARELTGERLDELLRKISGSGIGSLTPGERDELERASALLRARG